MKKLTLLLAILISPFLLAASCPQRPSIDKCAACDLYKNPDVVKLCKDTYCVKPTSAPTNVKTPGATSTAARPTNAIPVPTMVPNITPTPNIPTPIGTPPWDTVCTIPASIGNCVHTYPGQDGKYKKLVYISMQQVFASNPDWFINKGTQACPYSVKKAYLTIYYWTLQLKIVENSDNSVCTQYDGEQLNVKYDNLLSESFHPLRTDGDFPPSQCMSDESGIFTFTCAPAGF